MTPKDIETATALLAHRNQRRNELAQLQNIGTFLNAMTLHFRGGNERININLSSDIADAELLRVEIIEAITREVAASLSCTERLLIELGVEVQP